MSPGPEVHPFGQTLLLRPGGGNMTHQPLVVAPKSFVSEHIVLVTGTLIAVVAAIALAISVANNSDGLSGATDQAAVAESSALIGARHEASFAVAPRVALESDGTLAEFEASTDTFASVYEAGSTAAIGTRHTDGFEVGPRLLVGGFATQATILGSSEMGRLTALANQYAAQSSTTPTSLATQATILGTTQATILVSSDVSRLTALANQYSSTVRQ